MADDATDGSPSLRRTLGLRDVVLLFITCGVNLQWVATAAVAGPSALTVWVLACLSMSLPLGITIIELASRYPDEGGMYVWTKRGCGEFAGFMTGWTYWMSNLPYFPGVLYFAVANLLFIGGDRWRHLADSPATFVVASIGILAIAAWLNVIGLQHGKWLNNFGAIARWVAAAGLVVMGGLAWWRFGSATIFDRATLLPGMQLRDLLFWSTIAFAVTGLEAASFMGDEIRDPRRVLPRAIAIAAPIIALIYILGTASVLVALPQGEVNGLRGIMDAVEAAGARIGTPALVPFMALCIAVSALGSVGAWLGTTARLPFVAGIDSFLPRSFARIHPTWRTPHVALLAQAAIFGVCVLLGQAGTTVRGAYDVLVSMTVVATLIPFLFLFAAAFRLQRRGTGAGPGSASRSATGGAGAVSRFRGGRTVARAAAAVGFATTAVSIVLAFFPAATEEHKGIAVAKVAGLTLLTILSGVAVYVKGRRRSARVVARSPVLG